MKLKIKYLPNYDISWGKLAYANPYDSGLDLRAAISEPKTLMPGERAVIPNGISCEMQAPSPDYEIQVRPRSGLAAKKGITLVNAPGTIDWAYRGEIMSILLNTGTEPLQINPGDRIAQMVIAPVAFADIKVVDELSDTERAEGGFGSTGIKIK